MAPKQKFVSKKHIARLERERRQVRLIQYIAIGVVAVVVLVLGYGYLNINYLQARQPVAKVNGEKITTQEFQARVIFQRNNMINQYMQYQQYQQFGIDVSSQLQQIQSSLSLPSVIGQQVLDSLIDEALIRQEAARRGITVSADEVETFIQKQFGFYPDGTPIPTITPTPVDITYPTLSAEQLALVTITPSPTQAPTSTPLPTATVDPAATPESTSTPAPTPFPTATATPYTLEGFQGLFNDTLTRMKEFGLTEQEYRNLFETELLRSALLDEVVGEVPKEEEQLWTRHILVDTEEAAQTVIKRLNEGEDFSVVAALLSNDPGTKTKGGDLGWQSESQLVPEFWAGASALKVGEISEPVQSQFGWHVIQLLGRTTVPATASEIEQARQKAFDDFVAQLRENSEVTTYDIWMERVPSTPRLEDYLTQ